MSRNEGTSEPRLSYGVPATHTGLRGGQRVPSWQLPVTHGRLTRGGLGSILFYGLTDISVWIYASDPLAPFRISLEPQPDALLGLRGRSCERPSREPASSMSPTRPPPFSSFPRVALTNKASFHANPQVGSSG